MKPIKNKIFCKNCNRSKMLFNTEKEANRFIKFNYDEIISESGYAPQRSYFCVFCGGWHITSMKETIGNSTNEKQLAFFFKENLEKKVSPKNKIAIEKENAISLELQNQIIGMDLNQMKIFFENKIYSIKTKIDSLRNSDKQEDRKKIKELRQHLELVYTIRTQNGLQEKLTPYQKMTVAKIAEWKEWSEKKFKN